MNIAALTSLLTAPANRIRWLALLISALWSLVVINQQTVLNDDAYIYLRSVGLWHSDGFRAALAHYSWPAYTVLIGVLDSALPGDALLSAQVTNTLLLGLLVLAFIECSYCLYPTAHTRALAALTILLFPLLNEMRYFLIRDFGYWAFSMSSLWCLLQYQQQSRWRYALAWGVCLAVATLFRLEGAVLLLLAPLLLTITRGLGFGSKLLAALALIALGAQLLGIVLGVNLLSQGLNAYQYYLPTLLDLPHALAQQALQLNQSIFAPTNFPGADNVAHGVVLLLDAYVYTLLATVVTALGWPLTLLLAVALWRGWLSPLHNRCWQVYGLGCALSLLVFLSVMHFLTQRYVALLVLLLLLALPAALLQGFQHLQTWRHAARLPVLCAAGIVIFAIDSLVSFGHSRSYVEEGAHWLQQNLATTTVLRTNSFYLAYESGHVSDYDKISIDLATTLASATAGDTVALVLKPSNKQAQQLLQARTDLQLLQEFSNGRGDAVQIYQMR
jgi:hypothetical protein